MIYTNIEVEIPRKKRIRKTTNYVYEIIERKGRSNAKDKVVCVGKAISNTKMNPNNKYYEIHKEERQKEPLLTPSEFNNSIKIGGYLIINKILMLRGCNKILEEVFDKKNSDIIKSYLIYNLLDQNSIAQQYKYFASDNFTSLNYIPTENYFSKLFNQIISEDAVNNFTQKWLTLQLKKLNKDAVINIDLDSTNFNINTKNSELAQRGKPKVDEGLAQINVAYFLDRLTGLPIYFDIYFGSIIDMSHFKIAIEKVKEIAPNKIFSLVLDRGYYSIENIEFIEKNGHKYMCMGKTSTLLSELINEFPKREMIKSSNRIFSKVYGKKIQRKLFTSSDIVAYVYLYYNEGSEIEEKNFFQTEIEKAAARIIGKKDKNGFIKNTYSKYINITYDEDDIVIAASIKYDYLDELADQKGYFYIVSNEDLSLEEIYKNYRNRDIIEKSFKMSKTESDFSKKYSYNDTSFISKTLISFLSTIVRSSILDIAHPYFVENVSESSQTFMLKANQIKAQKISGNFHMQYELTKEQKQILSFFDLEKIDVIKLIDEINLSNLN